MVDQAEFARAILNPGLATPDGLTNPDGAPAHKRFDVYRNNVVGSLTKVLESSFPVIRKLVGNEFFQAMAGIYLRKYPPQLQLMMFYGQDMPEFLAGFDPVSHLQYLPDVARLELAVHASYHAADADPILPSTLQNMPADRLMAARVNLAPSLRLVRSRWPIHGIWRENTEDGAPQSSAHGENVAVTRPDYEPELTTLAPGGGTFLAALLAGRRFGEALDAATEQVPEFDLSETLGVLLAGAAIISMDEDTE